MDNLDDWASTKCLGLVGPCVCPGASHIEVLGLYRLAEPSSDRDKYGDIFGRQMGLVRDFVLWVEFCPPQKGRLKSQ